MEKTIKQILEDIQPPAMEVTDYNNRTEVEAYLKDTFPNIEPTGREIFNGLLSAYKVATQRLEEEKRAKEIASRRERLTRMWTAQEMYNEALKMGNIIAKEENWKHEFVVDKHNEKVFKLLCLYFTNDPKFEQYGQDGLKYSLKKGIWLQSGVRGSGKSSMLKCFRMNKRCCFGYKHTTELANTFQKGGFGAIDFFIGSIPQPSSPLNFYQNDAGFMYDELFGEQKVNHMGSPLMISEYIVNKLYDFSNNRRGELWKFHVTSNASGEDIENISGKTYRSRMPDMFNLIKLDGPNRRLQ